MKSSPDKRSWRRGLRPLLWWFLLVLVLYGIRTHERLSEQTRLLFTVSMSGQPLLSGALVKLDGKPFDSGNRVSIGSHRLMIANIKTESYSTNIFIWYGPHNLGDIALKRAFGNLTVSVTPPARWLIIRGPEWSATLKDSSGTNATVPTDEYAVEADFSHLQEKQQVLVTANFPNPLHIAPRFGIVQLDCNQPDASYRLQDANGQDVSAGSLPATITELPAGSYNIFATHHGSQRQRSVFVRADATNTVPMNFDYGTAIFETTPSGATVTAGNGWQYGETPLKLNELLAGTWNFTLQRYGYAPLQVALEVTANQTNFISTNLVSFNYITAMNAARQHLAAGDYVSAEKAAGEALEAKSGDADATAAHNEALGKRHLQRAEALGKAGDYISADEELGLVLKTLPDNEEVKQLLTDYQKREPGQIERQRQERLAIPKEALALALRSATYRNEGPLFEEHELKAGKPVAGMESAIIATLQTGSPAFQVSPRKLPWPDSFAIVGRQEFSGGLRQCVIVGAQTGENETHILFTVMEYKTKHDVTFQGGLTFNTSYVPLHPSQVGELTDKMKAQIAEGIQIVTARIQQAIGQ